MKLSEDWVKETEQLLRKMKELASKEKKDRLDIFNSIVLTLHLLERSLHGWMFWVGNPPLITQFSLEELAEIEDALHKQIQPFIEYDIEATKRWMDKFSQIPEFVRRRREEETRGLYV